MGLMIFCLNYLMAYRAQTFLPSALNAIVFSTIVWMNIINARVFFGVRASSKVIIGSVVGVAGLAIVFLPRIERLSFDDLVVIGALFAFLGAFSASLGNMISQRLQARTRPVIQTNAWAMLYGALATTLYSLLSGVQFTFDPSFEYVASLLYLAIPGSVIAFGTYLTLLGRIGAHRVGYVSVLFPIVALLISALFEGVRLSLPVVAGTALVLFGNVLVLYRRSRHRYREKRDAVDPEMPTG
jgi:drug/metabolite transporter (DMT)-like permease